MRAVIFANGWLNQPTALRADDLLIAADGGARHCLELGLHPTAVIGDLDSLSEAELSKLETAGAKIITYPRRKDYTDLELALNYALDLGADEILILAALGARWDQTIANILLPTAFSTIPIKLIDGGQEIFFLRAGEQLEIYGQPGDTVSLIPLTGSAHGISSQNLEYPLEGDSLHFGSTRGISNVMLTSRARVSLQQGLLLCIVIHS